MKPFVTAAFLLFAYSSFASAFTITRDASSGLSFNAKINQDVNRIDQVSGPYTDYVQDGFTTEEREERYEAVCSRNEPGDHPTPGTCWFYRTEYVSVPNMVPVTKCCKLQPVSVFDHSVAFTIQLNFAVDLTLTAGEIETIVGEIQNPETAPELVITSVNSKSRYKKVLKYLGNNVFEASFSKGAPLPVPDVYQKSISGLQLVRSSGGYAIAFKDSTPASISGKTYFDVTVEMTASGSDHTKKFESAQVKRDKLGNFVLDFRRDLGFSQSEMGEMYPGIDIFVTIALEHTDSDDSELNYKYQMSDILYSDY